MDGQGPGIESVAAALRRNGRDVALYAGFLLTTLTLTLPPELVQPEHRRSIGDRLRGRPGTLVGVRIATRERRFRLFRPTAASRPVATIADLGAGIVLKTRGVSLEAWTQQLAEELVQIASTDARAAEALQQLTITRGSDL